MTKKTYGMSASKTSPGTLFVIEDIKDARTDGVWGCIPSVEFTLGAGVGSKTARS